MNSAELLRKLRRLGAEFTNQGKGAHVTVKLNGKKTIVPVHGKKELKTGTLETIRKDLGLSKTDI